MNATVRSVLERSLKEAESEAEAAEKHIAATQRHLHEAQLVAVEKHQQIHDLRVALAAEASHV